MKNNLKILFLGFFALLLFGCFNNGGKNKPVYNLKVGQKGKIYYSTNSCCFYCIENESRLKHVQLIGDKILDKGPKDCDGCNFKAVYIFKAVSAGTDTVIVNHHTATQPCGGDYVSSTKYVFIVR